MEKKYLGKRKFLALAQEILRRQGYSWLSNVKVKDCTYKRYCGEEWLCFAAGFIGEDYELYFYSVNGNSRRCSLEIKKDEKKYYSCLYRAYEEWELVYSRYEKAS